MLLALPPTKIPSPPAEIDLLLVTPPVNSATPAVPPEVALSPMKTPTPPAEIVPALATPPENCDSTTDALLKALPPMKMPSPADAVIALLLVTPPKNAENVADWPRPAALPPTKTPSSPAEIVPLLLMPPKKVPPPRTDMPSAAAGDRAGIGDAAAGAGVVLEQATLSVDVENRAAVDDTTGKGDHASERAVKADLQASTAEILPLLLTPPEKTEAPVTSMPALPTEIEPLLTIPPETWKISTTLPRSRNVPLFDPARKVATFSPRCRLSRPRSRRYWQCRRRISALREEGDADDKNAVVTASDLAAVADATGNGRDFRDADAGALRRGPCRY